MAVVMTEEKVDDTLPDIPKGFASDSDFRSYLASIFDKMDIGALCEVPKEVLEAIEACIEDIDLLPSLPTILELVNELFLDKQFKEKLAWSGNVLRVNPIQGKFEKFQETEVRAFDEVSIRVQVLRIKERLVDHFLFI